MVLGNFNKSAPPRNLDDWDGVALDITLEYFPNEDDPIPLSSPFLTIHPESHETLSATLAEKFLATISNLEILA